MQREASQQPVLAEPQPLTLCCRAVTPAVGTAAASSNEGIADPVARSGGLQCLTSFDSLDGVEMSVSPAGRLLIARYAVSNLAAKRPPAAAPTSERLISCGQPGNASTPPMADAITRVPRSCA